MSTFFGLLMIGLIGYAIGELGYKLGIHWIITLIIAGTVGGFLGPRLL